MKRLKKWGAVLAALAVLGMLIPLAEASNCRRRVVFVRKAPPKKKRNDRFIVFAVPLYAAYTPPVAAPCPNPPLKSVRRAAPRDPGYDEAPPAPPVLRTPPPAYGNSDGKLDQILGLVQGLERRMTTLEAARAPGYGTPAVPGAARAAPKYAPPAPPAEELELPPDPAPKKAATRRPAPSGRERVAAILNRNCAMCHEANRAAAHGKNFVLFEGRNLVRLDAEDKKALEDEVTGQTMPPRPVPPLSAAEKAELLAWLRDPRTS